MDFIRVASWAALMIFVAAPVVTMWIYAIVDVIRRRREHSPGRVAAWLLALVVLPVVASVFYLLRQASRRSSDSSSSM